MERWGFNMTSQDAAYIILQLYTKAIEHMEDEEYTIEVKCTIDLIDALRTAYQILIRWHLHKNWYNMRNYKEILDDYNIKYHKGTSEEIEEGIKQIDEIFAKLFELDK